MSLGHFPNHTSISFQSIWNDERDQWMRNEWSVRSSARSPVSFLAHTLFRCVINSKHFSMRMCVNVNVNLCVCSCSSHPVIFMDSKFAVKMQSVRETELLSEREMQHDTIICEKFETIQTHCAAWINNNFAMCMFTPRSIFCKFDESKANIWYSDGRNQIMIVLNLIDSTQQKQHLQWENTIWVAMLPLRVYECFFRRFVFLLFLLSFRHRFGTVFFCQKNIAPELNNIRQNNIFCRFGPPLYLPSLLPKNLFDMLCAVRMKMAFVLVWAR